MDKIPFCRPGGCTAFTDRLFGFGFERWRCTIEDSENSSSITIGGEGDDSKFSIRAEGFSMDVDMPSLSIDSEDFDLNNVRTSIPAARSPA